jgi:hypothetical protein
MLGKGERKKGELAPVRASVQAVRAREGKRMKDKSKRELSERLKAKGSLPYGQVYGRVSRPVK